MADLGDTPCERAAMTDRNRLPNRRLAKTFELEVEGLCYTASVGCFPEGTIGELFLSNDRSNSSADSTARDSAIVLSIAFQHGADLEAIRQALAATARAARARRSRGAIGISGTLSLRRFKAASFCDAMAGSLPFCATIPVT